MRFPQTGSAAAAATRAFYRDPPFAGGHFGPRMGLEPLSLEHWLPYGISAAEQLRKQRLFRDHCSSVYLALSSAAPVARAEALACSAIRAAQPRAPLLPVSTSVPLLVAAAERVPDDLLLLWQPVSGAPYQLLAASLCSPSYWRLGDKLGGTLAAVHAPVRGFPPELKTRMERFFERLPAERCFLRRNWSVHPAAVRFEPDPAREFLDVGPAAEWFVRSERQTVRRLADDLVLFTVRVDLHPLAAIHASRAAVLDLELALDQLAGDDLHEFGGSRKRRRVLAALAAGQG